MKTTLHRFLKYCTALLVLLLLVTNCEQVSDVNIENAQEKKVKSVTLEDFKLNVVNDKSYFKINALFDSNKVEKSVTSYRQNDEYTILTDKITLIELDHATTYTFVLNKNNNIEANHFYNLVVHIDDEQSIVKSEIIKYHPTANWFSNPLQEYDGTFEIIENNFLDLSEIFPNEKQISSSCHPQIYGYWECNLGQNHAPGEGTHCTSWTYYVEITNCSGGGGYGNNGGTNPGSGGNEGNPTDGGGSSSGTGSGSGVSEGTTPTSPTIPEDMEFDEDHLNIQNCIAIQHFGNLNLLSSAQKAIVSDYIDEKGCDNAKSFVEAALEAFVSDGDVDVKNEIILDKSFVDNPKLKCVYDKLKASNSTLFKNTIGNFESDPKLQIRIKEGNCNNTDDACCDDSNLVDTGIVDIIIEDTSGSVLDIASMILHEAIHAEISRYVLLNKPSENINDKPRIFEFYKYYKELYNEGNIEHIFMTERYIEPIAMALRKLDSYAYPTDYYKSYAWDGLRLWDANNLLSMDEDENYTEYREIVESTTSLSCD